jgi:hypothetical protein
MWWACPNISRHPYLAPKIWTDKGRQGCIRHFLDMSGPMDVVAKRSRCHLEEVEYKLLQTITNLAKKNMEMNYSFSFQAQGLIKVQNNLSKARCSQNKMSTEGRFN